MQLFQEIAVIDLAADLSTQFRKRARVIRYGQGQVSWDNFDMLLFRSIPEFKPVTLRIMKSDGAGEGADVLDALIKAGLRCCNVSELLTLGTLCPDLSLYEVVSLRHASGTGVYDVYLEGYASTLLLADHRPKNRWSGGALFPAVAL